MNNNTEKKISASLSTLLASIIIWFVSAGFIMWGWNTLAPHINCPLFTYWEIFAMRMGLSFFMAIIWQKKK
jgi:hypothetical protein